MRIATASLILMAGSLGSRLLGLVREQVIAALYGRTRETDLFTAAARVPTTLYDLLVGGVVTAALVPVITNCLEENPREGSRLISTLLILVAGLLAAVTVLLWLFAMPLAESILPGYSPEDRALAGQLLRLMAPVLPCLSLGGLLAGISVARRQFVFPSLGAAVLNLMFALSAVVFRPVGVAALAISFTVGAVAHGLWQVGGLRGLKLSPEFDPSHPGLRKILRLYVPVFLGLLASTAGVAFDTYLASFTGAGDLTAMRFATNIIQFAIGFVGGSIGLAALPTLSRQAAAEATRADYEATLTAMVRWVWLLTWGIAVIMLVLRRPLVGLLFERGQFGLADTDRTALALLAYLPGLPAAALDQQLIYAFYARQNTLTPVLVGVFAVGLYAVTAVALLRPLGMPGLALANSVQWIAHAVVMVWLARPLLGNGLKPLGKAAAGGFAAGVAAGAVAAGLAALTPPVLSSRPAAYLWQVGVGGGAGLVAYWLVLYLLGTPEADLVKTRTRALLGRVIKSTD
jgi:putative peptidoglycan lipid II flippase